MAKLRLVQSEKSEQFKHKPPVRRRNGDRRTREYLTGDEVKKLRAAAATVGRYGFRDSLLLELLYRHALRVSEVVDLTWEQFHFDEGTMHVRRRKNGTPATHYLDGSEMRRLKRLQRESKPSRFVFTGKRVGTLTTRAVHKIVARAGEVAGFDFSVHPHMLRHAKGFQLANRGADTRPIQGFLGHRDIKSTVVYTALAPDRFKGFESD